MSGSTAESRRDGVPAVGEVIAQKYRVEGVVGAGGMGVVVSARHLQLGQVVAIKLLTLPPDEDRRDEAIARFLHEAQAAAKLQSDHVVRIYDVGQLENGLPFMVMELLSGTDLGSMLDKRGALPEREAVDLVLQACAGVAEAHRMGIVHRDLKPSNLFVTTRSDGLPLLKVLDFGISKQLTDPGSGEAVPTFTNTRTLMGSPNYMSPEQIRDARRVDGRTDVWALGIILQELVTDAPVFRGESFPGICAAIVADPPMPVRTMAPDVSATLEAVIARCLEKDPQRRFQSIAELVGSLAALGSRSSLSGGEHKPLVYGSNRHIIAGGSSTPVDPPPTHSAQTLPVTPGLDATLESARLRRQGATLAALSSPESGVEVITTLRGNAKGGRKLAIGALLTALGATAAVALFWSLQKSAQPAQSTSASAQPSQSLPAEVVPFTLSIESEPPGADVMEGQTRVGTTPFSVTLTLPPGSGPRLFVLEKPNYEPYVVQQSAARGEVRVRAVLAARPSAPAPSAELAPVRVSKPAPAPKRPPPRQEPKTPPKAPSDIRLER
jgi:eukaryotic-like serine/threonine-protein kinase